MTSLRFPNPSAAAEVALLGGTAAMLLLHAQRDTLAYFIHPRYAPLVIAAAIALLLIAAIRARALGDRTTGAGPRRWAGYALLSLPLALGLLVPARPLGADAFAMTAAGGESVRATAPLGDDSRRWDLLQWSTAVAVRGTEMQGREADLVGFVGRSADHPADGFVVARLVIVCCVADGSGVGLPVSWRGGAAPPPDTWVRVRGTLGTAEVGGQPTPTLLATSVEVIQRPASPYLYP